MQEDERLKQGKTESAHLATTSKDKKRKKTKEAIEPAPIKKQQKQQDQAKDQTHACYFYGNGAHKKPECTKYHARRAKKGTFSSSVCS